MTEAPDQDRAPEAPTGTAAPVGDWLRADVGPKREPQRGYLICATPRSGSYFLCDLLRSTGLLGRPHEYFEPSAMLRSGASDYPTDLASQIELARRAGCSANGIYGAKVFPTQLDATAMACIRKAFAEPCVIHLVRRDLLGQAISLARAAQTGTYFTGQDGVRTPPFDAALLRDYIERIVRWNAAWQVYFARAGIVPLQIDYEDLIENPQAEIDRVAAALNLSGSMPIDPQRLTLRVQRDGISSEWRERFHAAQPRALFRPKMRSEFAEVVERRLLKLLRLLGRRRNA